jgi:hypothetical protein
MPTYQVDIEKSALNPAGNTVYWTNVYHVTAADQATAVTRGTSIVNIEKAVHAANTAFTKMRVQNVIPDGMSGSIIPLSGAGSRTTPSDFLAMFNTARVDFAKATGRPNRKYLRLFIGELETTSGVLTAAFITTLTSNYLSPILALGYVCDAAGRVITSGAIALQVQMRQLRRGSKRRTTPVI